MMLDNGLEIDERKWAGKMGEYIYFKNLDNVGIITSYTSVNPMSTVEYLLEREEPPFEIELSDGTRIKSANWVCLGPTDHAKVTGGLIKFLANKKRKIIYEELTQS